MALDAGYAGGGSSGSGGGGGLLSQIGGWVNAAGNALDSIGKFANQVGNAVNQGAAAISNIADSVGDISTLVGQGIGAAQAIDNAMKGQMSCVIGGIPLSIVSVETPTWTGKPSRYALEDGEPGEDHFQRNPLVIKVTGMLVSDHLLHRLYYEALKQMHIKRKLIPYVSGMEVRGNMMITQLSPSFKAGVANGYFVTVTLQQIHFAKAGKSEKVGKDPATGSAPEKGTTNGGGQPTGDEKPQDGSILQKIGQWVMDRVSGGK